MEKIPLTTPSSADVSKNMNPISVIWKKAKCNPSENRLEQLVSKAETLEKLKDVERNDKTSYHVWSEEEPRIQTCI